MSDRLRTWLNQLFSTEGFRGPVMTLLSGTTVVMALGYLAQPILTRLYMPDEFGIADYFNNVLIVLISFTSLRYEDALMLPEDDKEAAGVAWLSLSILAGFTVVLCILLFWRYEIATLFKMPGVAPWLVLVPPTLLAMRCAKIAELWLIRNKRYRHVSAGQVANTTTMVGTRIGLGSLTSNAGAGGLIIGYFLGQVVSFFTLGGSALRYHAQTFGAALGWRRMTRAARRYKRFPLFSTPSALLSAMIARSLPIFMLPFYFDETVVGLFSRAFNVLAIPLSLVGSAIASVFFVHAAEAHREERITEVTETVHKRLVMLGLFPTLALLVAGPEVFEVILGSQWRDAGVFVQYIGPWIFLGSVASPLTRIFDVLERQRLDFATSAFMFVMLGASLLIGGRTGTATTTLLIFGCTGAGVRLLQLGVLLRLAQVSYRTALRAYGRYLLFSIPGLLLIFGIQQGDTPWLTTVAVAVAGMIYAAVVLWKDRLLALRP